MALVPQPLINGSEAVASFLFMAVVFLLVVWYLSKGG